MCQRGGRRRYAVPRLFEEAEMLAALYTDSSALSRVGCLARRLPLRNAGLKALASRIPRDIPPEKVFSFDRLLLVALTKGAVAPELAKAFVKSGLHGADVIYSMYGEDFPFLEWAKARGAKIIIDVFVHPSTNRIVAEEARRFGRDEAIDPVQTRAEDAHSRKVFALADLLLCPSRWVAEGVEAFAPDCAHKVRVVPYGSSLQIREAINKSPTPGRILCAGRDPLRKGLHILAEAAALVREGGMELDVRCAGVSTDDVDWIEKSGQLNCLGTLPMDQMHREFDAADLFVLPSFSEGQAGVVLEAMASGCPVIATRESGVDFEPDCGIIVPAGDPFELARIIIEVVQNRTRRNQLAQGALRQAEMFSMEAWKTRLVQTVEEV